MHLDAEECEGDASDEGTARQEDEGGQHRVGSRLGRNHVATAGDEREAQRPQDPPPRDALRPRRKFADRTPHRQISKA